LHEGPSYMKALRADPKHLARTDRELRYMDPKNIAKDFPSTRERTAIAAVFEWISLNGVCAWKLKRGYTTDAISGRHESPYQGVLLEVDDLKRAERLLLRPKKSR
jgi:hypothetical protein